MASPGEEEEVDSHQLWPWHTPPRPSFWASPRPSPLTEASGGGIALECPVAREGQSYPITLIPLTRSSRGAASSGKPLWVSPSPPCRVGSFLLHASHGPSSAPHHLCLVPGTFNKGHWPSVSWQAGSMLLCSRRAACRPGHRGVLLREPGREWQRGSCGWGRWEVPHLA